MTGFSLLSAAVLTTCLTASGFCEEDASQDVDFRISQLEKQMMEMSVTHDTRSNNGYDYQSSSSSSLQMSGTQNPNRVMDSKHGCVKEGFTFQAEFLWWRAVMDNLEYAIRITGSPFGVQPISNRDYFENPDFEFDPGVRVSAGYGFGPENWDVVGRWTYHYTNPSDSTYTGNNRIFPIRDYAAPNGSESLTFADGAKGRWRNVINIADLEMGYTHFFSQRFSFRPHFGLKAAWINMDYTASYTNVTAIDPNQGGVPLGDVRVSTESSFWSVGAQAGISGNLHIGWGFSLYMISSEALLYGKYETRYRQRDGTLDDFTVFENDAYRMRSMTQLVLGLEWAKCFSNGMLLAFNLGWEGQYWWNQHEIRYGIDYQPSGDLTFTGLDAGIRFDF